jgi:starvation-inducible outer membrane lipoprotein
MKTTIVLSLVSLLVGCATTPAPIQYEIKEIKMGKISVDNQRATNKAVAEMEEATKNTKFPAVK